MTQTAHAAFAKAKRPTPPPYGIIYNWDGNPHGYSEYPQSLDAFLAKVYAPIENTQVGALFWCAGQHEAKWPSTEIPMIGDAVDRRYDTLLAMRGTENVRALFERGEDPYAAIVARGRELGLHVWASVRMNDNHFWAVGPKGEAAHPVDRTYWMSDATAALRPEDMAKTTASELTQARKDHPEWCLGDGAPPWASTSWNMAIPEVRELRLQFIKEACELADWDGIGLDWQRHSFHLPEHDGYRLRYTLTDLQRAARKLADGIAERRGRPFHVSVRVAATLESCRRIGYDVETWAREGLCDIIVPAGNSGLDPDIDMEGFARILDGTGVKLYPGLDTDFRLNARRLMPHLQWRDAWIRGLAAGFWDRGADGMYAFNWHATKETRRSLLTTIGNPETLERIDKVYAAVHGTNAPKGTLRAGADMHDRIHAETPVVLNRTLTGEGPTFDIPVHDDVVEADRRGDLDALELQIELEHYSPTGDRVEVLLDGEPLSEPVVRNVAAEDPNVPEDVDENSWLVFVLRSEQADRGPHRVHVRLVERDVRVRVPLVVNHVEVHVRYRQ